ncbi:uncharacterized protein L969DRAFT_538714 [Mixia osmundae IAM 14324]|uniref:Ubiquitin carboxyl-terminal hydrolase n=1 Tax=Mixia osmundae (strain CBS 9802 / IAM 14324 / JCM 22182 / KY 12970) TaxID=764103 RepID=G7E7V1_MIXOS|nr:uncharacterized protein L969DRAFT_538714 [Mixia osmundae IAM 14324]KEI38512.1 hypothetical protein L969DRAFT_538714 [Mixia osmundae IAM 14324]GAA98911.1 hypothetical protein E5Q_05599 [Mixia osmundae IAM 14324]
MSAGWSLTESDPSVFSAILWELGVKGVEVEELYGLDAALLEDLQPQAFIFLFKYLGGERAPARAGRQDTNFRGYFAHQVIENACGTLAILNATMNLNLTQLGPELSNLKDFSSQLDPQTKGEVLTNSEVLRQVHNSFARSDPFQLDEARPATEDDDVYHFIVYLPIDGHLYELDGLQPWPLDHGAVDASRWTDKAKEVIQARIATYPANELHFNLMAICEDRLANLQSRIDALQAVQGSAVDTSRSDASLDLAHLQSQLSDEQAKRQRWAFDNALRRHNHVGLVHALLEQLAKAGQLSAEIEQAKAKANEQRERRRAAQKAS